MNGESMPGRFIVVWGVTGSGKTTFSRQLAALLDLPRIELDALFWNPGWVETPDDAFRAKVQAAVDASPDGWVLDGSYSRVSDIYLARADTVIWLHLPWRVSFWRLLLRCIRRSRSKERLYYEGGPQESWRRSFLSRESILLWSATRHRYMTRARHERIAALRSRLNVIELRSGGEVRRLIEDLAKAASGTPHQSVPTAG